MSQKVQYDMHAVIFGNVMACMEHKEEVIRYDEITVGQTCTHILYIPCSINEPTAKGCTAMLAGKASMALHAFHHAFVFTFNTIAHTYRTTICILFSQRKIIIIALDLFMSCHV